MTTDDMLQQMQSVLFFDDRWHARRHGSPTFFSAATPREAMRLALDLAEELPCDTIPNPDLF